MTATEKSQVEKKLAGYLQYTTFFGISFYAKNLILLFKAKDRDYYVRCENSWDYFDLEHDASAYRFQDFTRAQLLAKAANFSLKVVKRAYLDPEIPNLNVIFEDHSQLYISGYNERYECWQLGEYGKSELVACLANQELRFRQ